MNRSIYTVLKNIAWGCYIVAGIAFNVAIVLYFKNKPGGGTGLIATVSMFIMGLLIHALACIGIDVSRAADALEILSHPEEEEGEEDPEE